MARTNNIVIRGAREHNLRDVALDLPRGQLICFTGVSGSGKSSLAFDTLYAEGQRRYVESLSSYARQFLGQLPKPQVDRIDGLSPSIAIQQKTAGRNPRSTVGTITEISDYLRVLYARVGVQHCPSCDTPVAAQTRDQIAARILQFPTGAPLVILAPIIRGQKGEYRDLFAELSRAGYVRARVDGQIISLSEPPDLDRQIKHDIELVIDRITPDPTARGRLSEAVEAALKRGDGSLIVASEGAPDLLLSSRYACAACGIGFDAPAPQLFSFNSPQGMCKACDGLGIRHEFDPELLVTDPTLSLWDGAIAPLGAVKEMGRWRRHLFEGLARTLESDPEGPPRNTLLKGPWADLNPTARHAILHGTGARPIIARWKSRGRAMSHAEPWKGVATELLEKYRDGGWMWRTQLEPYIRSRPCSECGGSRLNPRARSMRVGGQSLSTLGSWPIDHLAAWFEALAQPNSPPLPLGEGRGEGFRTPPPLMGGATLSNSPPLVGGGRKSKSPRNQKTVPVQPAAPESLSTHPSSLSTPEALTTPPTPLDPLSQTIAEELLKEIRARLSFLVDVGLHYLSLDRGAPTLSGGEAQRIRLASQVGAGLVGVLYILDEPSIGLHPRDNDRLIATLQRLRDQGNTVIVVEHDEDTMRAADHLVDFGPGPGVKGGSVVAAGSLDTVSRSKQSLTGQYLAGHKSIPVPAHRRAPDPARTLTVRGARHHNLKNIDVEFPLGLFLGVTGVSGSGKSSLVSDILRESLTRDLNGATTEPGDHDRIDGIQHLDKIIDIDQTPIGRTPRSNPSTYIKLFDLIRDLYTKLPDSKARGYKPGRFSFNVPGGRCEACEGNGSNKLEMDFLADVWITCPVCVGKRFNRETLHVRFKGKSIADVLEMDVQEALDHFANIPKIHTMLQTLHDVGLDYMKLGQPSPTLSGGEAQRIKLAKELVRKSTGRTLYVLDEPTTGLHFDDVNRLLDVLHGFVKQGNTVVVIEHNLDVIKTADWIIDLGPEGGDAGGYVLAQGTPEQIAATPTSHTGKALARLLHRVASSRTAGAARRSQTTQHSALSTQHSIQIRGAAQHNLKSVDVDLPRHKLSVFSGPSGSGKSSLAIDTLYAEGQRRYVESLSSYARQFLAPLQKPKVEHISGLAPAICIEQKTTSKSPRSTVGTVTEIHDYLRILFARLGQPHCPACALPIGTQSADEIIEKILHWPDTTRVLIMAPVQKADGDDYPALWDELRASGFARVRVDGTTHSLDDPPKLSHRRKHSIEVVVDRAVIRRNTRSRLADSVEAALDLGRGVIHVVKVDDERPEPQWILHRYSQHRACDRCGRSFEELAPQNFSFNSPLGWCTVCEGLGVQPGADPAILIPDGRKSLRQGAIDVWPRCDDNPFFARMIEAMAHTLNFSLDAPVDDLDARHRRQILHGTGDLWFSVPAAPAHSQPAFSFQYKGLFPAIEEAGRVSFPHRVRLQGMVGEIECVTCMGARLRDDAAAVRFQDFTLDQIARWPLQRTLDFFHNLNLSTDQKHIAGDVLRELTERLTFLVDVGLDYLSLARPTPTLSGGEAQRIRLASQLGSGLTGVLYVLDEPTIGLHPRDNNRLLDALKRLRDLGNTLVVVEHDRDVIEAADHLVDFGPGSGAFGGEITAHGTPKKVRSSKTSLTGRYLAHKAAIPVPTNRRTSPLPSSPLLPTGEGRGEGTFNHKPKRKQARRVPHAVSEPLIPHPSSLRSLNIRGARHHNLKNINATIPLAALTVVTGVSGSGKSSLVEDILARAAHKRIHRTGPSPGAHDSIDGLNHINKVITVDQSPIGSTPASNPATYTGLFDLVRDLFVKLPEARRRGFTAGRFSFNVPGGRCEACEGNGQKRIEMHFLPDVWVTCDACNGKRYSDDVLAVQFRGRSIADILAMTIDDALNLFTGVPKIRRILQTLHDVGLGYVPLGQAAPTLSGGEAQRVKLAAELARPDTGNTLYLLDEPTTGLHVDDVRKLLTVLHRLADLGNTVVIVEHNLDVIKSADWIIDLGPEAGLNGGHLVAEGTPEQIAETPNSHTARFLKPLLDRGPHEPRERFDPEAEARRLIAEARTAELVVSAELNRDTSLPWQADGRRWHTRDRVTRTGKPCRWDGSILDLVIDRLAALGGLPKPDWTQRSSVTIPSPHDFGHAVFIAQTNSEWVLTLGFRLPAGSFTAESLARQLALPAFSEAAIPVPSDQKRVRVLKARTGQEVWITAHTREELETEAFDTFLQTFAAIITGSAAPPDPWSTAKDRLEALATTRRKPR